MLRVDYIAELSRAKRHEEAFNLLIEDLERDDNNSDLYQWAVSALQKMQCDEEAIQLLDVWSVKHPDNQEAFIAQGDAYKAFAWVARGDGWASTVSEDGWRLMHERMEKAVMASTHATELASRDCRTWASLLSMGIGASFHRDQMEKCFSKVLEINPYYYTAFADIRSGGRRFLGQE
jgi:tetratricopeptide (TPR) repeat protein